MKVDLKEFMSYLSYMQKINNCPIDELEVILNDKEVKLHPSQKEDFKFTGLNNKDYLLLFL